VNKEDEKKRSVETFFPVDRSRRPRGHLKMGISFKVRDPDFTSGKKKPSTMSDIQPDTGRRSC